VDDAKGQRLPGSVAQQELVFRELMRYRIRDVLLVSSPYDSYILQEDAFLGESLDAEYQQLNLSAAPQITQVSTGEEALAALAGRPFDLVITMARLGEMAVQDFGRAVKERHPDLPVILLAYSPSEAARVKESDHRSCVDQVFIWRGDVRIFLAIIKYVEDRRNAERDTELAGVRLILLIENSVRFYSSYLPLLYAELMRQNQSLMADGVNTTQRLRRMRARPKILLAETYEEGWQLFEKYRRYILGVISDARFPREGRNDPEAGIDFIRGVKRVDPDMPALVQSSDSEMEGKARSIGAAFLHKRSPRLLEELQGFIQKSLGFGDFVFVLPDGVEVDRVPDLAAMPRALRRVPEESLRYHATRNHFSNWCMARTEFALAARLRPVKVSEFESTEDLRRYLIDAFSQLRSDSQRGVVAEFSRVDFDEASLFGRIGSGSMGGKGRGLGFVNAMLPQIEARGIERGVQVLIPPSAVVGTDVFDDFVRDNRLSGIALSDAPDGEIAAAFLKGRFADSILSDLRLFVERIHYPLAVRSSSLLEDSHEQPFAGIYRTYMLANSHPEVDTRLEQLCAAIKLVYASTYFRNAKAYLTNTPHRMEEEKMAVVLQKLVGRQHGQYFYPDFAGVACSHNYYPVLGTSPEDGVVLAALGFGKTVVDGERSIRFSPARPQSLPQFSSTADILENAQREFYALNVERSALLPVVESEGALERLGLEAAEEHGTLAPLASVYSHDNDAVYDGLSRSGVRLVTLAPILKSDSSPFPRILSHLLALGHRALSCPVEIEFAVNLKPEAGGLPEFAFLQIRPMVVGAAASDIDGLLERTDRDAVLCECVHALGQGRIRGIHDLIYVKPEAFDRAATAKVALEVGEMNSRLVRENKPYLLIGPGRWGTSDPWLGIPVEWHQISAARAIIETDLGDVPVTPSEGTHFFQNLTSFGIGYFNIHQGERGGRVDFDWLARLPALAEGRFLRHIRLQRPLDVWVDGRSRRGLVLKSCPDA
jgi:hypothetical protein